MKVCHGLQYDQDGGERDCMTSPEFHCVGCDGDFCEDHWSEGFELCLGCLGVNHKDDIPKQCEGCGAALDPDLGGHCPGCS